MFSQIPCLAAASCTTRHPLPTPPCAPADYISKVPVLTVIFTLMPWSMLAKGSLDLGQASMDGNDGISWSNRKR